MNSLMQSAKKLNGPRNALSDIKRLLTSRDSVSQNKACCYLIEVISRYQMNSNEQDRMLEYLLENDITVFLCEATSNLDYSLFKSIVQCFRLLWSNAAFFTGEHACQSLTAVLRSLAYYTNSGSFGAVELCLHFLCDLFNGMKTNDVTSQLSNQSAYSAEQLILLLKTLAPKISNRQNNILSSALVLQALISHQQVNLNIRGSTAAILVEVLKQWFPMMIAALNHFTLVGDESGAVGMFYVVTCQLGIDSLSLTKVLREGKSEQDFIQTILVDEQEVLLLKQCANELARHLQSLCSELVNFTKENQNALASEDYGVFLKFLLGFLTDNSIENHQDFCDMLFVNGYLKMLPQAQIARKDVAVKRSSTLVLGELLKVLSRKYLQVQDDNSHGQHCDNDLTMGLSELQGAIEMPQTMGLQLQRSQTYVLIIYAYFYSQSSDNPAETTGPLLPFLIEHILRQPVSFKPPNYIVKALWLVFAMSTISNDTFDSLEKRIYLEKATQRMVTMIQPDCRVYYTHNPAILLWTFTSQRIVQSIKIHVLSQWLSQEDTLPFELSKETLVWDLLLKLLTLCDSKPILFNALKALNECLENGDEADRKAFAMHLWGLLPDILSKLLIEYDYGHASNICYILELAATLVPTEVDAMLVLKIAVLLSTIFSKSHPEYLSEERHYLDYVFLKLSLYLLGLSFSQNDKRVLLTYINRPGYLPKVLSCSNSGDSRVACASLQLLSYVVHYYTKSGFQPKSILQVETTSIVKSLREDSISERTASLLQFLYMMLNSGANTPLLLSDSLSEVPGEDRQCNALKALMFRIQMLCCKESAGQSSAGWKTLSSIFKYAIVSKNDKTLVATLTTQPWTHTLIHFQLTQNITHEFLTFLVNWLTLYKITLNNNRQTLNLKSKIVIFKNSLFYKTLCLVKKYIVLDNKSELKELNDVKEKILLTVREIANK